MKTLKKTQGKNKNTRHHVNKILVEDPATHHLLSKSSPDRNINLVADLIQLKASNDSRKQSYGLLISSVSLCLSLLIVIALFEWKMTEGSSSVNLEMNSQSYEDLVEIPQTQQIQRPPVQDQVPAIIEVDDEEIIEEIEINLDIEMTEETRIEEIIYVQSEEEPLPEENVDEIFTIVEEQPSPVGGMKAFYDYVGANLKYPPRASRMGIEGRVFVEFVVERDGSLTDIRVAKGIGGGCDEEAIRVISEAPNWNPGKQRGRNVRVRMIMPIVFKLLT